MNWTPKYVAFRSAFGVSLRSLLTFSKIECPINSWINKAIVIKDKPIIEWELEWLAQYGINHAILAIGHLSEKIINHLGDTYHTKYGDIDIS